MAARSDIGASRVDGFLGDHIATWTRAARAQYSKEFQLCEDLNRAAIVALFMAKALRTDQRQIFAATLLGRAIQTFEGAILLAERGMIADARTLVRSVLESALALAGVSKIPDFCGRLAEAEDKHRLSFVNEMLGDPQSLAVLDPELVAQGIALKKEMASKYGATGPKGIKWDSVARHTETVGLYMTIYRSISGDGAHATVGSLMRHVNASDEEIIGLTFGARDKDLASTLSMNISSLLTALDFAGEILQCPEMGNVVKTYLPRWQASELAST